MKRLFGMVNATITPMREDGSVDEKDVAGLCDYLAENGVHCLYPNGTNGEALLLKQDERMRMAEAFQNGNRGRCVLYVQCGAMTTEETYSHVRHARKIGADGAGIMTPVFFPVDEKGMERYYEEILEELPDFPVYAYNIFTRSGNDVSAALLGRLMERHANLHGIKFSYPDLLRVEQYAGCCERGADVLIGCDNLALCCLTAGGAGYVSGPGAVFPKSYTAVYDLYAAGDFKAAKEAQAYLLTIQSRMNGIPEIPAIKYMLWKKGVISTPVCRRPLRALDSAETDRLDALLKYAKE